MDRRGFFKRFAAAATAFTAAASGSVALASVPAKAAKRLVKKTPQVAITADTTKFEKSIGEAGRAVVEMLRKCRVAHFEECISVGSLPRCRAIFKYAGDDAPMTHLDEQAWRIVERGHLTDVTVTQQSNDIVDLNHIFKKYGGFVDCEIDATWIVVPTRE